LILQHSSGRSNSVRERFRLVDDIFQVRGEGGYGTGPDYLVNVLTKNEGPYLKYKNQEIVVVRTVGVWEKMTVDSHIDSVLKPI